MTVYVCTRCGVEVERPTNNSPASDTPRTGCMEKGSSHNYVKK
jgi:DNA-directed RNA polymerase subunit RPC12/RpoP